MAAGVTLASERLGEWRAFLEERLGEAVAKRAPTLASRSMRR